jgi:hypothetical protein
MTKTKVEVSSAIRLRFAPTRLEQVVATLNRSAQSLSDEVIAAKLRIGIRKSG